MEEAKFFIVGISFIGMVIQILVAWIEFRRGKDFCKHEQTQFKPIVPKIKKKE